MRQCFSTFYPSSRKTFIASPGHFRLPGSTTRGTCRIQVLNVDEFSSIYITLSNTLAPFLGLPWKYQISNLIVNVLYTALLQPPIGTFATTSLRWLWRVYLNPALLFSYRVILMTVSSTIPLRMVLTRPFIIPLTKTMEKASYATFAITYVW